MNTDDARPGQRHAARWTLGSQRRQSSEHDYDDGPYRFGRRRAADRGTCCGRVDWRRTLASVSRQKRRCAGASVIRCRRRLFETPYACFSVEHHAACLRRAGREHFDRTVESSVPGKDSCSLAMRIAACPRLRSVGILPGWQDGAPCRTRTCDLLVRSQTLYPTELRARDFVSRASVRRAQSRIHETSTIAHDPAPDKLSGAGCVRSKSLQESTGSKSSSTRTARYAKDAAQARTLRLLVTLRLLRLPRAHFSLKPSGTATSAAVTSVDTLCSSW